MITYYDKTVAALALAWILLSAFVTVSGSAGAWGMMPSEIFSAWWIVPSAVLSIIMLLAALSGREKIFVDKKYTIANRWQPLLAGAALILAIAAAWLLRSENHFLGDGWEMIGGFTQPFALREHEPLDLFIHQLLFRLFARTGLENGEYAYSILHVALFPLYILLLWRISRRLVKQSGEILAVFLLLLSTSALQLFSGYVESYTLVNLCLAGYMLAMLRHLDNRNNGPPILPAAILLLASAFHMSAVALIPSLAITFFPGGKESKSANKRREKKIIGPESALIFAVCLLGAIGLVFMSNSNLLVPLKKVINHPFTLLSIQNFCYKLNFIVFAAPVALVPILLLPFNPGKLLESRDNRLVFLFWTAASAWGFALLFDPLLGIRDWDIFAITGLPTTMLAACLMLKLLSGNGKRLIIGALALAAFSQVMTFVWTNSEVNRGLRFLITTSDAELHRNTNFNNLAYTTAERGYARASLSIRNKVDGAERMESLVNMGMHYNQLGFPDSALRYIEPRLKMLRGNRDRRLMLLNLIAAHDVLGNSEKASEYYEDFIRKGFSLDQAWLNRWINITMFAEVRNRYQIRWISGEDDPMLIHYMVRYYAFTRNSEAVLECCKRAESANLTAGQLEKLIGLFNVINPDCARILSGIL